jgi:hypothetical protein
MHDAVLAVNVDHHGLVHGNGAGASTSENQESRDNQRAD